MIHTPNKRTPLVPIGARGVCFLESPTTASNRENGFPNPFITKKENRPILPNRSVPFLIPTVNLKIAYGVANIMTFYIMSTI